MSDQWTHLAEEVEALRKKAVAVPVGEHSSLALIIASLCEIVAHLVQEKRVPTDEHGIPLPRPDGTERYARGGSR